jgi:hypothetical protein
MAARFISFIGRPEIKFTRRGKKMERFDKMDKVQLRNLLNKGWMTHDGMWFFHCVQECGIEKTNKINKAAVRTMAMVEVKRIKKALGLNEISSFNDIKILLEEGFEIIRADFMNFDLYFPEENIFRWEIPTCFAYEAVKKLGVADQYQCGIVDRVLGWFDGLGIKYSLTPSTEECLMHTEGKCSREFKFSF